MAGVAVAWESKVLISPLTTAVTGTGPAETGRLLQDWAVLYWVCWDWADGGHSYGRMHVLITR